MPNLSENTILAKVLNKVLINKVDSVVPTIGPLGIARLNIDITNINFL